MIATGIAFKKGDVITYYSLLCQYCGDGNLEPLVDECEDISDMIVYCNCCSKTGTPTTIPYGKVHKANEN